MIHYIFTPRKIQLETKCKGGSTFEALKMMICWNKPKLLRGNLFLKGRSLSSYANAIIPSIAKGIVGQ